MLLTISVTVIAATMVIAVVFVIPVLLQVRRTHQQVEKTLETVRAQIAPLSHDLTVISQGVNGILQSILRQVEKVEDSIGTVQDAAARLRRFEEGMLRRIEEPLLELGTLISAMTRGVEAFLRIIRR